MPLKDQIKNYAKKLVEDRPDAARLRLQEQASNHPVLLRSKDVVVSDREKSSAEGGRCVLRR